MTIEEVTHKSEEWRKFWNSADDAFWLKYYDDVAAWIDDDILDYLDEKYEALDYDSGDYYFIEAAQLFCRRHSPHLVNKYKDEKLEG